MIKVKKILECVCLNCGRLKVDQTVKIDCSQLFSVAGVETDDGLRRAVSFTV